MGVVRRGRRRGWMGMRLLVSGEKERGWKEGGLKGRVCTVAAAVRRMSGQRGDPVFFKQYNKVLNNSMIPSRLLDS